MNGFTFISLHRNAGLFGCFYYINKIENSFKHIELQKKVNMTRKHHNNSLQTNPRHRGEEAKSNKSHMTPKRQ